MPSTPKALADPIDARLVRKLADILTETGLTEIEVEHDGLKVRVARTLTAAPMVQYAAPPMHVASAHHAPALPPSTADAPKIANGEVVKSPMVGTVYLQPNPESPAFVKVGDMVQAGQTLFIVEAMKTMNPLPAPKSGRLVEILIGDAQPVEFGEPLAVID